MPIFGWIRDLFGIQKDMYDTKKTRLEINELEGAEREKLITPATLDDVRKYDPKYRAIKRRVRKLRGRDDISLNILLLPPGRFRAGNIIFWLFILLSIIILASLLFRLFR
jgi:hypothetical protein